MTQKKKERLINERKKLCTWYYNKNCMADSGGWGTVRCHGNCKWIEDYEKELQLTESDSPKGCSDCWHNYHCPMPQEGYDFNPDTCKYNPDNK